MGLDTEPPPPREWLLGRIFARCFLSGLIGTGGALKTTIRIHHLLAAATGYGKIVGETVNKRSRVLVVCLEDDGREVRRRVRAARMHHRIPQEELVGWFFFTSGNLRSHSDWRIKCRDSRAERAHAFAQDSLRNQFKLDFTGVKLLVKIFRARTGKGRDDAANLAILEEESEFAVTGAAIIADDFQVAGTVSSKALN